MTFHCRGGLGCCFINKSLEDGHLGGRLVCNYGSHTLGGLVEMWEGEGGLDLLVGRRGTNQLRLLEWYLDVLVKHTTEIPPPTALVEETAPSALVEDVLLR